MCNIWKIWPDSSCKTITIKQNVRFQGSICAEKCQLDEGKNGRHAAIIDNMHSIWKHLLNAHEIRVKI